LFIFGDLMFVGARCVAKKIIAKPKQKYAKCEER
jgi:hypothetical protein